MIDDSFGHWLAGFSDGEGCFFVTRVTSTNGNPNNRTWPNARFDIGLRADDRAILEEIRRRLGMGRIYRHNSNPQRSKEMTALHFSVFRIGDCLALVELFEKYPLRAKKRDQFEVWREAVREIAKGRGRSDERIDELKARLTALRRYDASVAADFVKSDEPRLVRRIDRGEPPECLCGCGQTTHILSHFAQIPHPDNRFFCRFLRGHSRRIR